MYFAKYHLPIRWKSYRLTILALVAILNLIFPQSAQTASSITPSDTAQCLPVSEVATDAINRLPIANVRPARRTLRLAVTAYSSTVDQTDSDPFTTASGTTVSDGTVAYNFLPFGTQVRFPDIFGDKIFIVEDRLNARAGPHLADIWMPTRSAAIHWGKRVIRMEIL
jgi:3D (Asp-Asp-Asp) domain-containing protein